MYKEEGIVSIFFLSKVASLFRAKYSTNLPHFLKLHAKELKSSNVPQPVKHLFTKNLNVFQELDGM